MATLLCESEELLKMFISIFAGNRIHNGKYYYLVVAQDKENNESEQEEWEGLAGLLKATVRSAKEDINKKVILFFNLNSLTTLLKSNSKLSRK